MAQLPVKGFVELRWRANETEITTKVERQRSAKSTVRAGCRLSIENSSTGLLGRTDELLPS
jgi:hypothetical protein